MSDSVGIAGIDPGFVFCQILSPVHPEKEKQEGSQNGGCRVCDQEIAVTEGYDADSRDGRGARLAKSSGDILHGRGCASFRFGDIIHKQVVDPWPAHVLHCEIENIKANTNGSGSGGRDQQEEGSSTDLNCSHSFRDTQALEKQGRKKNGTELGQLGCGENSAKPPEKEGKSFLKIDGAK
jgi:hypothetical protein